MDSKKDGFNRPNGKFSRNSYCGSRYDLTDRIIEEQKQWLEPPKADKGSISYTASRFKAAKQNIVFPRTIIISEGNAEGSETESITGVQDAPDVRRYFF